MDVTWFFSAATVKQLGIGTTACGQRVDPVTVFFLTSDPVTVGMGYGKHGG